MLLSMTLICITVGITAALVYRSAKADLESALGDELLAVANASAALLDTDLVELIHRGEDGRPAFREEFDLLRAELDAVRRRTGLPWDDNPIYIMRPLPDFNESGRLEFVVMLVVIFNIKIDMRLTL